MAFILQGKIDTNKVTVVADVDPADPGPVPGPHSFLHPTFMNSSSPCQNFWECHLSHFPEEEMKAQRIND